MHQEEFHSFDEKETKEVGSVGLRRGIAQGRRCERRIILLHLRVIK